MLSAWLAGVSRTVQSTGRLPIAGILTGGRRGISVLSVETPSAALKMGSLSHPPMPSGASIQDLHRHLLHHQDPLLLPPGKSVVNLPAQPLGSLAARARNYLPVALMHSSATNPQGNVASEPKPRALLEVMSEIANYMCYYQVSMMMSVHVSIIDL